MKKYANDLTYKELDELVKHNSDIEEKAADRAMDDVYFWLEDYLHGAPRSVDYRYFGRDEYFEVSEADTEFMNWVDNIQRTFEWLNDDIYEKCKKAHELWRKTYYGDATDEEYEEYEGLKEEIGSDIFELMKADYWWALDSKNYAEIIATYPDWFFEEGDWVDTDTWEIHNIDDEESENLDSELNEQLELPML